MPIDASTRALILENLQAISRGERVKLIAIGYFSEQQFNDLNAARRRLGLHEMESREIVFIGRHLYSSRNKDGYTVEDMVAQIESALAEDSVVVASSTMTAMDSAHPRADGYGKQVRDRAIFECTQRKPRAELFSVIPKGDEPPNKKGPPEGEPFQ